MTTTETNLETGRGDVSPAQWAKISGKAIRRSAVVAGLLVAGIAGMRMLERAFNLTFDKPPMPLAQPLVMMEKRLGPVGHPRYVADHPDDTMEEAILEVLGTKNYLLRTYTDRAKRAGEPGMELGLNVNYYDTGNSAPHVPEICWAGSGHTEAARHVFTVPGVHRADGTVQDVKMRMISFDVPQDTLAGVPAEKKYLNVAYLFEVNGDCVATPKEVISSFWKASNPHAYHSKIEVTVKEPCTPEEAETAIKDFIEEALPAVEKCLPARDQPAAAGIAASAANGNTVTK